MLLLLLVNEGGLYSIYKANDLLHNFNHEFLYVVYISIICMCVIESNVLVSAVWCLKHLNKNREEKCLDFDCCHPQFMTCFIQNLFIWRAHAIHLWCSHTVELPACCLAIHKPA